MKDSEAMCTVVVSLAPEDQVPLLCSASGMSSPAARGSCLPALARSPLIGGLDEQAGGTWLAVHPDLPRVSCILNPGRVRPAGPSPVPGRAPAARGGRGTPLLKELYEDPDTLARYDPFYLVCADLNPFPSVQLLGWDGRNARLTELEPATHLLTNAGHMYPPASDNLQKPPDEKAQRFGPKFAARRPSGDPAATLNDAWADWLTLVGGDGLSATDPGAIIVRRELPDGRVWGSTSATLIALDRDGGLRYDFQPDPKTPTDPTTWYSVDTR